MEVKPIDKITVKDLVEICGVNRQTFYYHFDDVYDLLEWVFEGGREREPPERGRVRSLEDRCYNVDQVSAGELDFALNVYNSNSRLLCSAISRAGFRSAYAALRISSPRAQYREAGLRICR